MNTNTANPELDKFLLKKERDEKAQKMTELIEAFRNDPRIKPLFANYEKEEAEKIKREQERKVFHEKLRELNTKTKALIEKYRREAEETHAEYKRKKKEYEKSERAAMHAAEIYSREKRISDAEREQARRFLTENGPKELSKAGKVIYRLMNKDAYMDAVHVIYKMEKKEPLRNVQIDYVENIQKDMFYKPVVIYNREEVDDFGIRLKKSWDEFLDDMCDPDAEKYVEKWIEKGKQYTKEYENLKNMPRVDEVILDVNWKKRMDEVFAARKMELEKKGLKPIERW